jgi:hypothetical protein
MGAGVKNAALGNQGKGRDSEGKVFSEYELDKTKSEGSR